MAEMSGQNMSYDPGMTYDTSFSMVDTGAMRETIARVNADLMTIEAAEVELDGCLRWMKDNWQGSAASLHTSVFSRCLSRLVSKTIRYKDCVAKIAAHAERREQAHAQAVAIAQEATDAAAAAAAAVNEIACWAEV